MTTASPPGPFERLVETIGIDEVRRRFTPRVNKYMTHVMEKRGKPLWPKQVGFLLVNDVREVLYGGAAGGGKSDCALMGAIQFADVPGYAALLLRRTYADLILPDALIPRSHEWLRDTDASWSGQDKAWRFPSGATLTFGYLEHEDDKYRYQGSQLQYVCFDELTQHSRTAYEYLFSRLRRAEGSEIPLRMRSTSNPGGKGMDWVKERFIDTPGSPSRLFIPAKLKDNPALDYEAYVESLSYLDPTTRAQLLEGDWTAREPGGFFRREWFRFLDVPPAELRLCRFWDLAATEPKPGEDPDWTAGALLGIAPDNTVHILDVRRRRGTPHDIEDLITETAEEDGREVEIYFELEPGASGRALVDQYRRRVLQGFSVRILNSAVRGSKTSLASHLSSQVEARNVSITRWGHPSPTITEFLDEMESFPNGSHDDMTDAVSSAFYVLAGSAWSKKDASRRITSGTMDYISRRTIDCIKCGQPVWFPVDSIKVPCQRCGAVNERVTPGDEPALTSELQDIVAGLRASNIVELVQTVCPGCHFMFAAGPDTTDCPRCGYELEGVA